MSTDAPFISGHGLTVRAIRYSLGLSPQELAELMGYSYQSISYWERNVRRVPRDAFGKLTALQTELEAEVLEHLTSNDPMTFTLDHSEGARPLGWQMMVASRIARIHPMLVIQDDPDAPAPRVRTVHA